MPRHQNDRNVDFKLTQTQEHFQPIHVRHFVIDNDATRISLRKNCKEVPPVPEGNDGISLAFQQKTQGVQGAGIIINNKDGQVKLYMIARGRENTRDFPVHQLRITEALIWIKRCRRAPQSGPAQTGWTPASCS